MKTSAALFQEALSVIPGGVNSPVRAFNGVGGTPIFIDSAQGAYIYDTEGKAYIDYVGSWGPMILGHAHPRVIADVSQAVKKGLSFGAPTALEIALAKKIQQCMPSIEKVRMVSSGTEATMSAVRLARGYTGREKFIKFSGCYHGHADFMLVAAGSGSLTLGVPNSAGVPASIAQHTLIAEFNDLDSVAALFAANPDQIAAIIVEPVAGNMNCVLPTAKFLQGLRDLCDQHSAVLIFDEVMTGFRVALGGAQALYQIQPDLTTLGKIVGGGMPVGAFGGKREIMDCLAPIGDVYQAGTLSGNPIAMQAGLTTLNLLTEDAQLHAKLSQKTQLLLNELTLAATAAGVPFLTTQAGGMFGLYFTVLEKIQTFADVKQSNVAAYQMFFHHMLDAGIYLAPSAFEAGFTSIAHTDVEIEKTVAAAKLSFAKYKHNTPVTV